MVTTFYLEIVTGKYTPISHRLTFGTQEAALEQLESLAPKIGTRRYNDPDNSSHRLISLDGEMVIATEEIVSARVVDQDAFDNAVAETKRRAMLDAEAQLELLRGLAEIIRKDGT
jgi:hypothetical protein